MAEDKKDIIRVTEKFPALLGAKVRIGGKTGPYSDQTWYGTIIRITMCKDGFMSADIYSDRYNLCHLYEIEPNSVVYLITKDGKPEFNPLYNEFMNEDITRQIDRIQSCTPTTMRSDEKLEADYPTLYGYVKILVDQAGIFNTGEE